MVFAAQQPALLLRVLPLPGGRSRMQRDLVSTIAVVTALALGPFAASIVKAQGNADSAAVRVKGDVTALELDLHEATLAQVMSALSRFNIRYRSAVALNEVMSGTYAGSLGRVLSRILDGYNYAIRHSDAKLDVIVVGRSGGRASATPPVIPIRQRRSD
jgi:hypothetical protein